MSRERRGAANPFDAEARPPETNASPGKRTLTERLSVQRHAAPTRPPARAARPTAPPNSTASDHTDDPFALHLIDAHGGQVQGKGNLDSEHVQEHAARGVADASSALPHAAPIQAAFGHHDVSAIRASVGGAATDSTAAIGATAYAIGDRVAFASSPDLHTAAHEAAHVVQQRGGVQLKGGVGEAGDRYEQHADQVADAVVRGDSAEMLLYTFHPAGPSQGVQRQAATSPSQVAVTVEWTSPFGSDLDGKVTLFGSNDSGKKKTWTRIDEQDVAAVSQAVFGAAPRYMYYRARVEPADDVPGDKQDVGQFEETGDLTSGQVQAAATQATVQGWLNLNRWNRDNVRQRHASKDIDPVLAANVRPHPLFGRVVQVHDFLAPRVATTHGLYLGLHEDTQRQIDASIFVSGGYAYRNRVGKAGSFSNHSIGSAIDVNYNEGKLQNALMDDANELALLAELVQPVVRTDPDHATFDIWRDNGQAQLTASLVFNQQFPGYLAELLDRDDDVTVLAATEWMPMGGAAIRASSVRTIFATITKDVLEQAVKVQTNGRRKRQLELISKNWSSLSAWVLGAPVVDQHAGQRDANGRRLPHENKTAVGMIPLHEIVLQMFLDTGWEWGGDWAGIKDYMHFEDPSIEPRLKI